MANLRFNYSQLPEGIGAPSAPLPFTFVVDSDAALAAWANVEAEKNYSHVLIKSGTWTSALAVNLTAAGTKAVVGQAGNLLSFTSQYGLKYDALAADDCWIQGVNVALDYRGHGNIQANGFYYCAQLSNCTAMVLGSGYAPGIGFYYCNNIINCMGITGARLGGADGDGGSGAGFYQCRYMLFNKSDSYTNCFMSTGSEYTNAVNDTAAGGWNRIIQLQT
jgi:hypothetical protein